MKPISGWDQVQAEQEREPLPLGAYVCRIMGAVEDERPNCSMLAISFDISEGEYKDYYANNYRSQTGDSKKWKGVIRLFLPREDGSDQDKWTKSRLKAATEAIESSNKGFRMDLSKEFDLSTLKGKTIGVIYRNEEYSFNGYSGWSARPFKLYDAEKIRSGEFKLPKDRPLKKDSKPSYSGLDVPFDEIDEDDDLPF